MYSRSNPKPCASNGLDRIRPEASHEKLPSYRHRDDAGVGFSRTLGVKVRPGVIPKARVFTSGRETSIESDLLEQTPHSSWNAAPLSLNRSHKFFELDLCTTPVA